MAESDISTILNAFLQAEVPKMRRILDGPHGALLLQSVVESGLRDAAKQAADNGEAPASAFYLANEFRPENLAGSTARLFLGVKLECAQCHNDRSGGNWSRNEFWQFAAFFTDVTGQPSRSAKGEPQITIPNLTGRLDLVGIG